MDVDGRGHPKVLTTGGPNGVADLLASVQPELRIVWVLREVDDMSYEEIAQTLNLTESTVRGRQARARSLVMRQMKEWA